MKVRNSVRSFKRRDGSIVLWRRAEQRTVHGIFFHGGDAFGMADGDGVVGPSG
jgi:hypothetical protein